jgi:tetratricopeptide (TPR) repeat protein
MVRSQNSLIEQAKQGEPKAIAILLSNKLQPKGITAKASIKNRCLHIMLEAAKTPPQQPLVESIRRSFSSFRVEAWDTVKVYGKQVGEDIPDWVEDFKVVLEPTENLENLAKQGNKKAITKLINQWLRLSGVVAKVSLKDDCLKVMLEAPQVPDRQKMISLLQTEMLNLKIQSISMLKLYGKESNEEFPNWHTEINLALARESQETKINSSHSIENSTNTSAPPSIPKIDSVDLSNRIYEELQTTCYQHLTHKVALEDKKTIHEIVEDFVNELEVDIKLDLDLFAKQFVTITKSFDVQLELTTVKSVILDILAFNFTGTRLAIREIEKVTLDVLKTDFPQETDALKSFFTGAAQEFTANLFGQTTMSPEAIVGATLGTIIAPGIGSAIGGAIGGWISSNKQQKTLQALLDRYQLAREKLFHEWDGFLRIIYRDLKELIFNQFSINLLDYQVISQSIEFYNQGNIYLTKENEIQKSIEFYNQAINLNSGLALAWNNKGYVLNYLGKYEEALVALDRAIKIKSTLVIAFNNRGDALKGLGKKEEAISAYEQSIKLDPENYAAWLEKGRCLYACRRYKELLQVCEKLILLDANNYLSWYAKACCHTVMQDTYAALENLKEAVRLNPEKSHELARQNIDFEIFRKNEQFIEIMESSVGVSYAKLKEHLKERKWKDADLETACLIVRVIEKVTNSKEISQKSLAFFPCADLNTIDRLWSESSDGRFGFSIQKNFWKLFNQDKNKLGEHIGWRIRDTNGNYLWLANTSFIYSLDSSPPGHLPSSIWAGQDGWFEDRRDRLISLFIKMDSCSIT